MSQPLGEQQGGLAAVEIGGAGLRETVRLHGHGSGMVLGLEGNSIPPWTWLWHDASLLSHLPQLPVHSYHHCLHSYLQERGIKWHLSSVLVHQQQYSCLGAF